MHRANDDLAWAKLCQHRHRAEIELLAIAVAAPRLALRDFEALGVEEALVINVDTTAMLLVITEARNSRGAPWSSERIVLRIRDLLQQVDLWDPRDCRPFVTGNARWGPGPLAKWSTAVSFDSDLLRRKARELREVDARQSTVIQNEKARK